MVKDAICRYCFPESKDTPSKLRNSGSFLSEKWGQSESKGLADDKAQSTKIYEAKDKLRRGICSTSDKLYGMVFVEKGPQVPPKVKFGDMILKYRWLMCNIVYAVMSCVIGAVIYFLAILFSHFINPSQGSPEILEDISYALLLAFTALSTSNAIGLYLLLPLPDDGCHSSALQLLRKLSELRQDLSHFESSIVIQNEKPSLKLMSRMVPFMEGKLYDTLLLAFSAKQDVMKMTSEIKPILEKAYLRGEPKKIVVPSSFDEEEMLFKQFRENLQRLFEIRKSERSHNWTVW